MNGNDAQAKAAKFGEQNVSKVTFGKCLVDLFICAGNLTQANVHCFFCWNLSFNVNLVVNYSWNSLLLPFYSEKQTDEKTAEESTTIFKALRNPGTFISGMYTHLF